MAPGGHSISAGAMVGAPRSARFMSKPGYAVVDISAVRAVGLIRLASRCHLGSSKLPGGAGSEYRAGKHRLNRRQS